MVDTVSPEVRSRIMAQVKSKGMKPEMRVRRLLHGMGYRYRLHRSDLPGRPDLVFPSRRKVVFVNGCFWHYHRDCERVRIPATNQDYWGGEAGAESGQRRAQSSSAGRGGVVCDDDLGVPVARYGIGDRAAGGVSGSLTLTHGDDILIL